jgi:uncharacterized RDD family membrane protein YckC
VKSPAPFRSGAGDQLIFTKGATMGKTDVQNDKPPKKSNAAISAFKHEREKGFIRNRVLAALIDFIIVAFLCQFAFFAFGTPDWKTYLGSQEEVRGLPREDLRVVERARLYNNCFIVSLAIGASYEALFFVLFDTTPGKRLFGLKLVPKKEERGFLLTKLFYPVRAVVKAFSIYLIAAIPFIFMCVTVYGNEEGRSGFDMLSGTKVISKYKGITKLFSRKS